MFRFANLVVCLTLVLVSNVAVGGQITEVVVFGDSLSDAGNDLVVFGVPAPPYFDGRFADGPVWVDQFTTIMGLPAAEASLTGGTNYAYGGAETGDGSSFISPFIPNMGSQIDDYLAGNTPDSSELFVVFGGHNNFRGGETDPSVPIADIEDHITTLAAAGATQFLVSTIMPLGQLPETKGTPLEAPADALAVEFNSLLNAKVNELRISLGITIYEFDVHSIMLAMIADPAAFGLTNVVDAVYVGDPDFSGDGTIIGDPAEYLYWDDVHPTTAAASFFADAAAASIVPEPATISLAVFGALGLLGMGRTRRELLT